jgi:tRNA U34 2-thiouridine synthase MnmA/TrmU
MKAVGLFSGGLDSALSAKLISDLGIEVHAAYFRQPWFESDLGKIRNLAEEIGVHFHVIDLKQDYLEMLQQPQHGYGKAFNPCVDCHQFMVRKAGELMKEIGAKFVFTGEVVGQRPMSQRKACLPLVEKDTGLEGYVLRPLSAQLLDPTVPETEGWVDRNKLLAISGRGRREQMDLAKKWGIEGFIPTGGGCLVTQRPFGARMKDFLQWGCRDPQETVVLKWGRYFRLNEKYVAIAGRDKQENDLLERYAHPEDHLLRFIDRQGPLLLLKGKGPGDEIFSLAGGIVQRYSKARAKDPEKVFYQHVTDSKQNGTVVSVKPSGQDLKAWER